MNLKRGLPKFQSWQEGFKAVGSWSFALAVGVAAVWLNGTHDVRQTELSILRQLFELRGACPAPESVAVVLADSASHEKLGTSHGGSLPASVFADALEKIELGQPKAILVRTWIPDLDDEHDFQRVKSAVVKIPTAVMEDVPVGWRREINTLGSIDITRYERGEAVENAARVALPDFTVAGTEEVSARLSWSTDSEEPFAKCVPLAEGLAKVADYKLAEAGPDDMINFYGPANTIAAISVNDLLSTPANELRRRFEGRVVLFDDEGALIHGLEPLRQRFYGPLYCGADAGNRS